MSKDMSRMSPLFSDRRIDAAEARPPFWLVGQTGAGPCEGAIGVPTVISVAKWNVAKWNPAMAESGIAVKILRQVFSSRR